MCLQLWALTRSRAIKWADSSKILSLEASSFLETSSECVFATFRDEIDRIQSQVLKMRDTYQSTLNSEKTLSQLKMFQINDKFELNRDDASYTLSIEAEVPIDNVLLQCDVPIDLLDSDKNSCVISYSECNPNVRINESEPLSACFRSLNLFYLSLERTETSCWSLTDARQTLTAWTSKFAPLRVNMACSRSTWRQEYSPRTVWSSSTSSSLCLCISGATTLTPRDLWTSSS